LRANDRYKPPFDRHDWTIDRCGKQVEYIIDFYGGQGDKKGGKVSFYLDVRPKLTVEGGKMRLRRWIGELLPQQQQQRTPEPSSSSSKTN
jgi:cytochrome c heme-lyase